MSRLLAEDGCSSSAIYDSLHCSDTANRDNNTQIIRSLTGYTSDGNFVTTKTNSLGKTIQYEVDTNSANPQYTVTSVTDPKGTNIVKGISA